MIAYLKGDFTALTPSTVLIEAHGIGYEVNISLNTYSQIQHLEKGLLFTHFIVREDAHLLYGFSDVKEKEIFLHLLSVSGIGANTARLILSYMKPEEVSYAILQGNSAALERIKGIGKKTAERAVLELRDKVGKHTVDAVVVSDIGVVVNTVKQDALEALLALGINKQQAELQVSKLLQQEPDLQLEALIKKVLKGI